MKIKEIIFKFQKIENQIKNKIYDNFTGENQEEIGRKKLLYIYKGIVIINEKYILENIFLQQKKASSSFADLRNLLT